MFVQNQDNKEAAIRNENDSIQKIDTIEEDMLEVQTSQAPKEMCLCYVNCIGNFSILNQQT